MKLARLHNDLISGVYSPKHREQGWGRCWPSPFLWWCLLLAWNPSTKALKRGVLRLDPLRTWSQRCSSTSNKAAPRTRFVDGWSASLHTQHLVFFHKKMPSPLSLRTSITQFSFSTSLSLSLSLFVTHTNTQHSPISDMDGALVPTHLLCLLKSCLLFRNNCLKVKS